MSTTTILFEGRTKFRRATPLSSPSAAIALSLTPNTQGGVQGTMVQASVTLARQSYADDVSLAVTGLPTGVTAGLSETTLAGTTLTSTLTLTIAGDATVGEHAITITASGTGVSDATATFTLTVTPAVAALTITDVSPSSGTASTPTAITITGTGFDTVGSVTVTVGGEAATSVVVNSATEITCTTPSLVAGNYDVVVTQTSGAATRVLGFASGALLLAHFNATADFGSVEGNFDLTKNGQRLYYKGACQIWDTDRVDVASAKRTPESTRVFRFNRGSSNAEIRFDLDQHYPELFIEYYVYMPDGTEDPSVGLLPTHGPNTTGTTNDKFFRLWGGQGASGFSYGAGNTVKLGAGMYGPPLGVSQLGNEMTRAADFVDGAWTRYVSMGQGGSAQATNPKPDVYASPWLGTWVRFRHQYKAATIANNDGIIRIWFDDTLMIENTSCPCYGWRYDGIYNAFRYGYIFGFRNGGGVSGSYIYVDDVKISTGGFV